ncbi:MAG: TolC family protein [Myxococcales bacterium]|nr:TolC family protein [Myxococcales bacterium]
MNKKKSSLFFFQVSTILWGAFLFLQTAAWAQVTTKLPEEMPFPAKPTSLQKLPSFDDLWKKTLQHNPTLQRIRSQFALAAAKIKQTGAWPDLQIGIQASNFPMPNFQPTMMTGVQYTIAQKFPILSRLDAQRSIAKAELQKLKLLWQEEQVKIAYALREHLLALWDLRLQWTLRLELYQLTQQVASVARTRYAASTQRKQDLLLALLQLAQLQQEALQIKLQAQQRELLLARLTQPAPSIAAKEGTSHTPSRLESPPSTAQTTQVLATKMVAQTLHLERTPPTFSAMLQKARTQRPLLQYWWVDAKQAKLLKQLAIARYWPEITLRLDLRQRFANSMDQGEPFISLGVQIPLPTWGNPARQGLVEEAGARFVIAQKRLQELLADLRQQLKDTLQTIRNLQQQQTLYTQQLLPLAQQTYQASLASYQVGKEDFSNLLGHLKRYLSLRLQERRLQLSILKQRARLLALQGNTAP